MTLLIISCEQCSAAFEANTSGRRFCSDSCKYKARVARNPVKCCMCGEAMPIHGQLRKDGTDVHGRCKKLIIRHGSRSGYRKGCRCDECRDAVAKIMREYNSKRTARDGISPTARLKREQKGYSEELMSCALCGERLSRVPANGKRGYHRECRLKVPAWIANGTPGPNQRRVRIALEVAARGRSGSRTFTQGKCGWCSRAFTSPGGSFFCSGECRRRKARRDRGSLQFIISPGERQGIYERDGWTCQLCDRPVDSELSHPDIWSASLDHIIPQSAMLIPDHSPENLRLSHLICNSLRRDEEVPVATMRKITMSRWDLSAAA